MQRLAQKENLNCLCPACLHRIANARFDHAKRVLKSKSYPSNDLEHILFDDAMDA